MFAACKKAERMPKMVQVRNVPDAIHRKLKSRAALRGQSLSEYLLQILSDIAKRPTREEMMDRLAELPRSKLSPSPTEALRKERDSR